MNTKAKILNFGSLNLDYVYQVDHFVRPGETLSSAALSVNPGGKGLNQSVALARAGAAVWHAGCVGAGGESLRALLEENGVNTAYLRAVAQAQGNAVIQVTPSGENCILLYGGSNQCLTQEQIDSALADFSAGDVLLLQNEVNALPYLTERAGARGLRIVLNPSPFDEKLEALDLSRLDWLLVNELEARQLTGSEDPERAWRTLHARCPRTSLLVTLGSAGSAAFRVTENGVEQARQAAFPVRALDTTAAGDTYTGYFLGALAEGRALGECMRRAAMASAISVTRAGAAPSIPAAAEVDAALQAL